MEIIHVRGKRFLREQPLIRTNEISWVVFNLRDLIHRFNLVQVEYILSRHGVCVHSQPGGRINTPLFMVPDISPVFKIQSGVLPVPQSRNTLLIISKVPSDNELK